MNSNIGFDCENIINNYIHQLEYSNQFENVMSELKENVSYYTDNINSIRNGPEEGSCVEIYSFTEDNEIIIELYSYDDAITQKML